MRDLIRDFVEICESAVSLPAPVYEFGSFLVEKQSELADLRPLFPSKEYVGCDLREGPGVDMVLDMHDIDLPDETAGSILSLDTFEHVEYPRKAIDELYRVLKPGGVLVISSVMIFPIHEFPHDYWRFTPDGFKSLLRVFEHSYVDYAGERLMPHTVVGLGFKGDVAEGTTEKLNGKLLPWKEKWKDVSVSKRSRIVKQFFGLFGLEVNRKPD